MTEHGILTLVSIFTYILETAIFCIFLRKIHKRPGYRLSAYDTALYIAGFLALAIVYLPSLYESALLERIAYRFLCYTLIIRSLKHPHTSHILRTGVYFCAYRIYGVLDASFLHAHFPAMGSLRESDCRCHTDPCDSEGILFPADRYGILPLFYVCSYFGGNGDSQSVGFHRPVQRCLHPLYAALSSERRRAKCDIRLCGTCGDVLFGNTRLCRS